MPKKRGSGEGSIFQRGNGRWVSVITVGYSAGGKRLRKTIYGKTKKEVTDKLTRLANQKLDGSLTTDDQERLGDYLTNWVANDTRLQPTTRGRYEGVIRLYINPKIGGMKISAVRPGHLESFMAGLRADGASEDTILICYSVLHRGFTRLVKQRRIVFHPCAALDRPIVHRIPVQPVDEAGVEALLHAAAGHRLGAVFVLAVTTGMRQGEIFGLQWDDVDLEAGVLSVRHSLEEVKGKLRLKPPKSKAGQRAIRLSMIAVQALRERWAIAMQEDAAGVSYVFSDTEGKPLRKSNFERRDWKPIRKAAKLPETVCFHDLRHTSASWMLKAGVSPKTAAERLGHSDVRVTLNTYSHVMAGVQDEAAALFDDVLTKPKPADGCQLAVNRTKTAPQIKNAPTEVEAP